MEQIKDKVILTPRQRLSAHSFRVTVSVDKQTLAQLNHHSASGGTQGETN